MARLEDLHLLIDAARAYQEHGSMPQDRAAVDAACGRILAADPFDKLGLQWRDIVALEDEIGSADERGHD